MPFPEMDPARAPFAVELFAQWQAARGARTEAASRPFTRGWESLLEDAGLVTAMERSDAQRDARSLQSQGWLMVKPLPYRPDTIDRIVIPLLAEARWCEAFGFVQPAESESRQIREFPWEPALAFVREARLNIPFGDLLQLNAFLKSGDAACPIVPIKERSLQIFGDEKRLDILWGSALFREGRLQLEDDLRCETIGVPLAFKRGPAGSATQPVIVLENAATWHSYCRWNAIHGRFSACVYGDGNRFADGIRYMADILSELGGPHRVLYFGDLDPQGLRIPQEASSRAKAWGLPAVEPHLWSYRHLLRVGTGQPWEGEPPGPQLCDWLEDCADAAKSLFSNGQRLAQEHVGWDFLVHPDCGMGFQPMDNEIPF